MTTCDYACCDTFAAYEDDGWNFCWQHYCEHRADMHGDPWPRLAPVSVQHLFRAPHGTTTRARKHYRDGEKPCTPCLEAATARRRPSSSRRGAPYRAAS